jgi:ketosteroid isomerase-like protein
MPQPSGGTAPGTGRYLVVWERQTDGTLKIAADMFGPDA